jgi:thiamine-triphosphatase
MIEVEKKFLLNPGDEERLLQGAQFVKEVVNADTYWDTADYRLSCKDMWLRTRNGEWDLKVPLHEIGHHKHVAEQYLELESEKEIREKLAISGNDKMEADLRAAGYAPFATIVTTRRKYRQGKFNIDLDAADFGYSLCEIEYMIPDDGDKEAAAQEIIKFSSQVGLVYSNKIRGKLLEYINRFRSDHYRAMQEAGVVWQENFEKGL